MKQESLVSQKGRPSLSRPLRIALGLLVTLHVTAVFVGPWSMPPYDSAISRIFAGLMHPYIRAMSLDNGYRFFAPEPGPSHLIRYEITQANGEQIEGIFPNLQLEQPRLYYHRHFMLSEFANTLYVDSSDSESDQAKLFQALVRSYAGHLVHEHDAVHEHEAKHIKLFLRRHNIPGPIDVLEGAKLDEPRWYEEKLIGSFERDELP